MAEEAEIPATLLTQMTTNIAFDFLVSSSSFHSLIIDFTSSFYRRLI